MSFAFGMSRLALPMPRSITFPIPWSTRLCNLPTKHKNTPLWRIMYVSGLSTTSVASISIPICMSSVLSLRSCRRSFSVAGKQPQKMPQGSVLPPRRVARCPAAPSGLAPSGLAPEIFSTDTMNYYFKLEKITLSLLK